MLEGLISRRFFLWLRRKRCATVGCALFLLAMILAGPVHAGKFSSDIGAITTKGIPKGKEWCQTIEIKKISRAFEEWVQFDIYRPGRGSSDEALSVKTKLPYKVRYRAAFDISDGSISEIATEKGVLVRATLQISHPDSKERCALIFSGSSDGEISNVDLGLAGSSLSLVSSDARPARSPENLKPQNSPTPQIALVLKPENEPVDQIKIAFSSFSLVDRKLIQQGLESEGFYSSSIDGLYGPGTSLAITTYLESVGLSPQKTSSVQAELSALKSKVAVENQKREQELEKLRIADEEALRRSRQINQLFLLEDITAFAKEVPDEFNALDLAILYTPAKKEFDSGSAGARFDQLLDFARESDQFIAFAKEREAARRAAERVRLDGLYAELQSERGRVEQLVAEDPFSESSMKMTLSLLEYKHITRDASEQDIYAAVQGLQAVAGIDLEVVDGKLAALNGKRLSDGGGTGISTQERLRTSVKSPVISVDAEEQEIASSVVSTADSCSNNPARCSLEQLCERATSYSTGKLDWDMNDDAAQYIDFAKRFGMRCGITKLAQVSSVDTASEPKKKPKIEKYKNRKALVIGNANYTNQDPLKNPINDAKAVSAKLEEVGFEVSYRENLGVRDFGRALADFERSLTGSDISLFYYAGHGIEIDKQNYLIPVDADIRSPSDVRYETVRLDDAVDVALNTSKLSMVLIDACRDNPYSAQIGKTRSMGRGLSVVEVNTGPVYQIVSFAAASGQVAQDGDGANSPYATVLVDLLDEPDLEVGKMFRVLGDRVSKLTNGAQQPTKRDNLRGEDIYLIQMR
ncbi:MAG: caspase family protein [Oceanospirillaceae bacterium]|nr:caspase family protein [Oceanospirillaceae bacterium]